MRCYGTNRRVLIRLVVALSFTALGARTPAAARPDAARIEAQYQSESDPVRKAKLLAKLGPLDVDIARDFLKMEKNDEALATIQHYRDEVRSTVDALAATKVNAEKHSAGFKELQIGLRECIRRMDDLIFSLPVDDRPQFEGVRSDLASTQAILFEELFPTAGDKRDNKKARQ